MEEFWRGLQVVRRLYFYRLEAVCSRFGITRAEMDVLLFLYHNPDHNCAADIVELQGLTKSHVSVVARALQKRQLITFSADEQDRRVTRLNLTEAAQEVVAAGKAEQNSYHDDLIANLSAEDLRLWRKITGKIMTNVYAMYGKKG